MEYRVEFISKAMKEFSRLPKKFRDNILQKLDILAVDPYDANNIKKLHGCDDRYRLRVGDYRVLYRLINEKVIIEIIKVAHRKEAYQ